MTHVLRIARGLRGLAGVTGACIVAALVAAPPAYASSVQPVISAATGGRQMTAANAGPSATFTSVGDAVLSEFVGGAGLVSTGRFTLKISAGFEFGTTPVSLLQTGNPATGREAVSLDESCTSTSQSGLTITPTADAITFYICAVSTSASSLGIRGMTVRPTAHAPVASGNIYLDNSPGAVAIGGYNGLLINFGTLVQNPGPTTQLAVTLPESATAGAAQNVTVTAEDAYGNATPAYRGTVHFTSSDPIATLPADYTFTAADAGVHAFTTPVFRTAGTPSLTVTDTATSITGIGTTTVEGAPPAGTISRMVLSPSASAVTAGAGTAFTAEGRDASDNSLGDVTAGTTFTIAPNGSCTGAVCTATVAGPHTITGTNSGATGTASLTVTPAAPVLTLQLTPGTLVADGAATSTALIRVADQYGNPRAADPVTLSTNGDATISAVHDNGDGSYTATVTASRVAGTQILTASVGAASATAQLVQTAPLSVTRVSPDRRGQGADGGASGQSITVTGTGFTAGALADFGPGVTVKSTSYTDASHLIAQVVVAPDATVGTRPVTVTLADGRSATCAGCFTVTAAPSITDVSPNQINPGAKSTVTITGANFAAGVKVTVSASGIAVTSTTVRSSTTLLVGISATSGASPGPRDLTITNPADGGNITCRGCFTVTGPVVTEVSPAVLGGGAQTTVTVTGANFDTGARLSVASPGVAVLSQTWVDATHLTATLSVAGAATAGGRTITVTNPNGVKGSCATCFAVATAPTVTGLTPATFTRGSTTAVTITGTGFQPGAAVSLSTGVSVQNVVVVDTATITATVTVSATTGTGNRTLVVTNPDFGKGTCLGCARVTYPSTR